MKNLRWVINLKKKNILKQVDKVVNFENYEGAIGIEFVKLFRNEGLISSVCFLALTGLAIWLLDKVKKLAIIEPTLYIKLMIVCAIVSLIVFIYFQCLLFLKKEVPVKHLSVYYACYKWFDLIGFIFQMIAVLGFVIMFVVTPAKVGGDSMEPNFHNEDRLLVWHLFYEPEVNDTVIIDTENRKYPDIRDADFIIKRVVAVSGSKITYENGHLVIDGTIVEKVSIEEYQALLTDFSISQSFYQAGEVTLPEGYLIVLGDNRSVSLDSRKIGLIRLDDVLGKSFIRIYPDLTIIK